MNRIFRNFLCLFSIRNDLEFFPIYDFIYLYILIRIYIYILISKGSFAIIALFDESNACLSMQSTFRTAAGAAPSNAIRFEPRTTILTFRIGLLLPYRNALFVHSYNTRIRSIHNPLFRSSSVTKKTIAS